MTIKLIVPEPPEADLPKRGIEVKTITIDVDGWDIPTVIRRLADVKEKLGNIPYKLYSSDYDIEIAYEEPESDELYDNRVANFKQKWKTKYEAKIKQEVKRYEQYLKLKQEFESESEQGANNDLH